MQAGVQTEMVRLLRIAASWLLFWLGHGIYLVCDSSLLPWSWPLFRVHQWAIASSWDMLPEGASVSWPDSHYEMWAKKELT